MARGTMDQTRYRSRKLEGQHVATLTTTLVIEDVAGGLHLAIRRCGTNWLLCHDGVVWEQYTKPGHARCDYEAAVRAGRLVDAA